MTQKTSVSGQAISFKGLSFERLQSFRAIVEAGTMVGAAKRDPTRQSLLSRQIKDLQEVFGTDLFKREGKYLRLTEAGQKLALITNSYFSALTELAEDDATKGHTWRIGANESVLKWLVFPMLGEVLPAAERNLCEFHNLRTGEVVEKIKRGNLDVGIVRADAATDSLAVLPFASMEYILIVPRSLLPGKSAAGIHHMKTLPVGLLLSDGQFVSDVIELASRSHIKLDIRIRAQSLSLLAEAVRSCEIAAFLPLQAQMEFPTERFAAIKLDGIKRLTRIHKVIYAPRAATIRQDINKIAGRLSRSFVTHP